MEPGLSTRLLRYKAWVVNHSTAHFLSQVRGALKKSKTVEAEETDGGSEKVGAVGLTFKPCLSGISSPSWVLPQHLRVPSQAHRCHASVKGRPGDWCASIQHQGFIG